MTNEEELKYYGSDPLTGDPRVSRREIRRIEYVNGSYIMYFFKGNVVNEGGGDRDAILIDKIIYNEKIIANKDIDYINIELYYNNGEMHYKRIKKSDIIDIVVDNDCKKYNISCDCVNNMYDFLNNETEDEFEDSNITDVNNKNFLNEYEEDFASVEGKDISEFHKYGGLGEIKLKRDLSNEKIKGTEAMQQHQQLGREIEEVKEIEKEDE